MHNSCGGKRSNKIIVGGGPRRPLEALWIHCARPHGIDQDIQWAEVVPMAALEASTIGRAG